LLAVRRGQVLRYDEPVVGHLRLAFERAVTVVTVEAELGMLTGLKLVDHPGGLMNVALGALARGGDELGRRLTVIFPRARDTQYDHDHDNDRAQK